MDGQPGTFTFADLTVPNADEVRDFYANVVGWKPVPLSMGDYDDYMMMATDEQGTGICWLRGENDYLPPVWQIYVMVEDLDASIQAVKENGGSVIGPVRGDAENGRFCCIKDPAGAYISIMQRVEKPAEADTGQG